MSNSYDAVVVGAGPNGLSAAITLARAGKTVLVLEASDRPGGGCRTAELTLPGFHHDVCATIQSMVSSSPFLSSLPLEEMGCHEVYPEIALAHALDGGEAVAMYRSLEQTATGLGRDERAYRRLVGPLVRSSQGLFNEVLGPLRPPRHPLAMARFGARGVWPAATLARAVFRTEGARALFAGLSAHAIQPLTNVLTSAFGLMLALSVHASGWPVARGGSEELTRALVTELERLGGEVRTNTRVTNLDELPEARAVLLDLTPRQVLEVAGRRFPHGYRRALGAYRYGPGVFKLDWALDGPIPWASAICRRAGTVHLGGLLGELVASEAAAVSPRPAERPFVILVQATVCDPTRAPQGKHTAWAYCHVPNGSEVDMTTRIEEQVERFAPGFRSLVLARHASGPAALQAYNANYVGGDINGGVQDWRQLFTRPVARPLPYATPDRRVYICSSSTPPGGGVHGMCGYWAARTVLARAF
ncbi:MAG: phytoene desaturase family protein [Candidatus Dormibacteria bacterium]